MASRRRRKGARFRPCVQVFGSKACSHVLPGLASYTMPRDKRGKQRNSGRRPRQNLADLPTAIETRGAASSSASQNLSQAPAETTTLSEDQVRDIVSTCDLILDKWPAMDQTLPWWKTCIANWLAPRCRSPHLHDWRASLMYAMGVLEKHNPRGEFQEEFLKLIHRIGSNGEGPKITMVMEAANCRVYEAMQVLYANSFDLDKVTELIGTALCSQEVQDYIKRCPVLEKEGINVIRATKLAEAMSLGVSDIQPDDEVPKALGGKGLKGRLNDLCANFLRNFDSDRTYTEKQLEEQFELQEFLRELSRYNLNWDDLKAFLEAKAAAANTSLNKRIVDSIISKINLCAQSIKDKKLSAEVPDGSAAADPVDIKETNLFMLVELEKSAFEEPMFIELKNGLSLMVGWEHFAHLRRAFQRIPRQQREKNSWLNFTFQLCASDDANRFAALKIAAQLPVDLSKREFENLARLISLEHKRNMKEDLPNREAPRQASRLASQVRLEQAHEKCVASYQNANTAIEQAHEECVAAIQNADSFAAIEQARKEFALDRFFIAPKSTQSSAALTEEKPERNKAAPTGPEENMIEEARDRSLGLSLEPSKLVRAQPPVKASHHSSSAKAASPAPKRQEANGASTGTKGQHAEIAEAASGLWNLGLPIEATAEHLRYLYYSRDPAERDRLRREASKGPEKQRTERQTPERAREGKIEQEKIERIERIERIKCEALEAARLRREALVWPKKLITAEQLEKIERITAEEFEKIERITAEELKKIERDTAEKEKIERNKCEAERLKQEACRPLSEMSGLDLVRIVTAANQSPANPANQSPANSANQSPANSANQRPVNSANQRPVNSANQSPANSANQSPANSAEQLKQEACRPLSEMSYLDLVRIVTAANQSPANPANQSPANSANQSPANSAVGCEAPELAPLPPLTTTQPPITPEKAGFLDREPECLNVKSAVKVMHAPPNDAGAMFLHTWGLALDKVLLEYTTMLNDRVARDMRLEKMSDAEREEIDAEIIQTASNQVCLLMQAIADFKNRTSAEKPESSGEQDEWRERLRDLSCQESEHSGHLKELHEFKRTMKETCLELREKITSQERKMATLIHKAEAYEEFVRELNKQMFEDDGLLQCKICQEVVTDPIVSCTQTYCSVCMSAHRAERGRKKAKSPYSGQHLPTSNKPNRMLACVVVLVKDLLAKLSETLASGQAE